MKKEKVAIVKDYCVEYKLRARRTKLPRTQINSSLVAADAVRTLYGDDIYIYETVYLLLLDRSLTTNGYVMLSKGGISGSVIDKRLVCKYAVDSLSSSVILVHNHPSGNLTPSHSDRGICKEITESLATLGIGVSDFLILTADGYLSFRDEGYM